MPKPSDTKPRDAKAILPALTEKIAAKKLDERSVDSPPPALSSD